MSLLPKNPFTVAQKIILVLTQNLLKVLLNLIEQIQVFNRTSLKLQNIFKLISLMNTCTFWGQSTPDLYIGHMIFHWVNLVVLYRNYIICYLQHSKTQNNAGVSTTEVQHKRHHSRKQPSCKHNISHNHKQI